MFYVGSYRVEEFKNLKSIPEILTKKSEKKDGLIFVISDTLLPTNDNYNLYDDFFEKTKKLISTIYRQNKVFNNIEAIVLNGNIVKTTENVAKSCLANQQLSNVIEKRSLGYIFLSSILSVSKGIPIYYVRGDEDCFMNNPSLPVEFRGVIKPCNALYIDNILFMHGHTGVQFHAEHKNKIISDIEEDNSQKEIIKHIFNQLDCNIVFSNSFLKTYKVDKFIRVGSFEKHGLSVINKEKFDISPLTENR